MLVGLHPWEREVGSGSKGRERGKTGRGGLRSTSINDPELKILLQVGKRLGLVLLGGFQHGLPDAHDALGADGVGLRELEHHLCLDLFSAQLGVLLRSFHVT